MPRARVEVRCRIFAVCLGGEVFCVGVLYGIIVCMLVRQILTVSIALATFVAERVIVCISVRARRTIVNILAVGVALTALVAERVIVGISVRARRIIVNVLAVGITFATSIAYSVIICISVLTGIISARYKSKNK